MLAPAFELPGFRGQLEERTPLHRVSTPDEIARPIRFLLSDEASFITGTHLTDRWGTYRHHRHLTGSTTCDQASSEVGAVRVVPDPAPSDRASLPAGGRSSG